VPLVDPEYSTRHPFGFVDRSAGGAVPAPEIANELCMSLLLVTVVACAPPLTAFIVELVLWLQFT
jgi:hypothetical protein